MWKSARIAVGLACVLALPGQDEALASRSRAARDAMLAGRYSEAITLYKQLVKALPSENRLRLSLALALEKGGQPSAAIPELQAFVHAEPRSAAGWFLLGLAHQQLGHPREAIPPLRKTTELDPDNIDARLELADAELASGNPRDAADNFLLVTKLQPRHAKAWQGLGLAYLASSERAYVRVGELAPKSGYAQALFAREHAAEGRYTEALQLYGEAIRQLPGVPGLHAARAAIYQAAGKREWAATEEQRELGVPKPDCNREVAACACGSGDWKKAIDTARTSATVPNLYWASIAAGKLAEETFAKLAQLPESAEIHELLAEAAQRSGQRSQAVHEWKKAATLKPGDNRIQGRLAEAQIKNREYEDAENLVQGLVQASPENAEWQYLLGETLFQQRRAEEALPHLENARKLRPDDLPTMEALGRTYLQLNRVTEAIPLLERAKPIDEGPIEFALSSAYRRAGREQDAAAALARYRELTTNPAPATSENSTIPAP